MGIGISAQCEPWDGVSFTFVKMVAQVRLFFLPTGYVGQGRMLRRSTSAAPLSRQQQSSSTRPRKGSLLTHTLSGGGEQMPLP
jgi:hypothetical protein